MCGFSEFSPASMETTGKSVEAKESITDASSITDNAAVESTLSTPAETVAAVDPVSDSDTPAFGGEAPAIDEVDASSAEAAIDGLTNIVSEPVPEVAPEPSDLAPSLNDTATDAIVSDTNFEDTIGPDHPLHAAMEGAMANYSAEYGQIQVDGRAAETTWNVEFTPPEVSGTLQDTGISALSDNMETVTEKLEGDRETEEQAHEISDALSETNEMVVNPTDSALAEVHSLHHPDGSHPDPLLAGALLAVALKKHFQS